MKHLRYILLLSIFLFSITEQAQSLREQKKLWKQVRKEIPQFKKVFKKYKKYRFEIIYTRVEHDPEKGPLYQRYYFGDHDQYFYPASTVKFPMALKTLQKVNRLSGLSLIQTNDLTLLPADSLWCTQVNKSWKAHRYLRVTDSLPVQHAAAMGGLNRETFCQVNQIDPFQKIGPGKTIRLTTTPAPLTLNEMLSEMLLYSNNQYFNWLFEFAVNETPSIDKPGIDVHKRLMVCHNQDSLVTRPLLLMPNNGEMPLPLPAEKINIHQQRLFAGGYTVGKKYYDFNDHLVGHGRNFSAHNALKLESLQDQLIQLMNPGYLPEGTAYEITEEQRWQLIKWMGMRPGEDKIVSDSNYLKAPNDLTNFLYTGQQHQTLPGHIRLVNIIGQAYGFVTDCAYMADEKNNIDFFLAARIYVNKDEVLNDDKYEYEEIAYPLMEQLGRVIYQLELKRPRDWATLPVVFQIFR